MNIRNLSIKRKLMLITMLTSTFALLLASHAMVSDRQKALEAGCDDYDTKPLDFRRLVSKIESTLHQAVNQ